MPKPGRRVDTFSTEIAHFTDREDKQEVFRRLLNAVEEPPVLMFYGLGGAGKSWLLKKLHTLVTEGMPASLSGF